MINSGFKSLNQIRFNSVSAVLATPSQAMIQKFIDNKSLQTTSINKLKSELERLYPKDATYTSSDIPFNIKALYFHPRINAKTHNEKVATLVFKSYEKDNLHFMADFAMRAGFYAGCVLSEPLKLKTERALRTYNKSPFVHSKSKQNFFKLTRKIQIDVFDTAPEALDLLLANIVKYAKPGVALEVENYTKQTLEGNFIEGLPSNKYMASALAKDPLFRHIKPLAETELFLQFSQNSNIKINEEVAEVKEDKKPEVIETKKAEEEK